MPSRVRYALPRLGGLGNALLAGAKRAAKAELRQVARDHRRQVQRGVNPDGAPQRAIAPATAARKGHSTPLLLTGDYADPAMKQIRDDGQALILELDPQSAQRLPYWRALGFDTWRLPRRRRPSLPRRRRPSLTRRLLTVTQRVMRQLQKRRDRGR